MGGTVQPGEDLRGQGGPGRKAPALVVDYRTDQAPARHRGFSAWPRAVSGSRGTVMRNGDLGPMGPRGSGLEADPTLDDREPPARPEATPSVIVTEVSPF